MYFMYIFYIHWCRKRYIFLNNYAKIATFHIVIENSETIYFHIKTEEPI